MFKYAIIILSFLLVACSPSGPTPSLVETTTQAARIQTGPGEYSLFRATGGIEINSVDLGTLGVGEVKVVSFIIKNTSSSYSPFPLLLGLLDSSFSLINNSCEFKMLGANEFCMFSIKFSAKDKTPGILSSYLFFGQQMFEVVGEVVNANPTTGDLSLASSGSIEGSLNFGELARGENRHQIITVTNNSNKPSGLINPSLSNNADYYILSNNCFNRHLNPNATCSFAVMFTGSSKTPGTYASNLMIEGKNYLTLSATIKSAAVTCSDSQHLEGQVCVANSQSCLVQDLHPGNRTWNGAAYSACQIVSCAANFHREGSECLPNQGACVISGGEGVRTYENNAWSACTVASCNAGYHQASNECESNLRTCSVGGGSGNQTYTANGWSSCELNSCGSGQEVINGACRSLCLANEHRNPATFACENNIQDCQTEIANASSASKVWNSNSYGACLAASCAQGFTLANNACVPETQSPGTVSVTNIYASAGLMCVTYSDQTHKCVGSNRDFNFGLGLKNPSVYATPTSTGFQAKATSWALGANHTCALIEGNVWCAGRGGYGQVGQGGIELNEAVSSPTMQTTGKPSPSRVPGANTGNYTAVYAGGSTTCATTAGSTKCWGYNANGQFGNGSSLDGPLELPQTTGFDGASQIAIASSYICAIVGTNVKCAGYSFDGNFGYWKNEGLVMGQNTNSAVNIAEFQGAVSLAVSNLATCAVLSDSSVKCVGSNRQSQLGLTATGGVFVPTTVAGFQGAKKVVMNLRTTCALMTDGAVKCTGNNSFGETGNGNNNLISQPQEISAWGKVEDLVMGDSFLCARKGNEIKCAGENISSKSLNSILVNSNTPILSAF